MQKSLIRSLVVACATCFPRAAWAHHVVSDYAVASTEPMSFLELDSQAVRFELDERRGDYLLTAPTVEFAFQKRVSGSLRVPMASIVYDDQQNAFGIGDIELGSKVGLFASPHGGLILSAGTGIELPTGNEEQGLGSGHFELSPYLVASSAPTYDLVLFGLVAERISLEEHAEEDHHVSAAEEDHHEAHGSVLSPHEDHELFSRFMAGYIFSPIYLAAGADVVLAWSGENLLGPVDARGEIGWRARRDVRVAVGADFPVAGENRFEWRVRTGLVWMF